jgi:hypothetical protein
MTTASSAVAISLIIIAGIIGVSSWAGSFSQRFQCKNNTQRVLREVWVECGFFQADELVGKGLAAFHNVLPGQTASGFGWTSKANADAARTPASRIIAASLLVVATAAAPSLLGRTIHTGVMSDAGTIRLRVGRFRVGRFRYSLMHKRGQHRD